MGKKRSTRVTVALVQMAMHKRPEENLIKAVHKIRDAAKRGAQIVCLPELFRSLYFAQSEDASQFRYAERIPGPTIQTLSRAARNAKAAVIAPVFEKRAQGVYHNSAVVIDADGSLAGTYRKMHIPDDPLYYEKFYFSPGDLGFKSFKTRYAKISVLICWDQWFPEAARLAALSGAQILFYPTAIGCHPDDSPKDHRIQQSAWEVVQRAHAVANGVFVAASNRVGKEGKLKFWGRSFVSGPFGDVLAQAGATHEETLVVRCDLGRIEETRQSWPFFRDRRIDAYQGLTSRFIDAPKGRKNGS